MEHRLAIKYNNATFTEPCFICGQEVSANIPLYIFKEDSLEGACYECIEKHAPTLLNLLNHFYKNQKQFTGPEL